MEPAEEDSKVAVIWRIQLAKLDKEGFNLVSTDGSGRGGHAAAAAWHQHSGITFNEYLGTSSTANDAEKLAVALALENLHSSLHHNLRRLQNRPQNHPRLQPRLHPKVGHREENQKRPTPMRIKRSQSLPDLGKSTHRQRKSRCGRQRPVLGSRPETPTTHRHPSRNPSRFQGDSPRLENRALIRPSTLQLQQQSLRPTKS